MFTRDELEALTIPELKDLCTRYGIKATGRGSRKDDFIVSLMAFPHLAIQQIEENRGLRNPTFDTFQCLGRAIDEIGNPTTEQMALIRISLEGKYMAVPDRFKQTALFNLYRAKMLIEEAFNLLNR